MSENIINCPICGKPYEFFSMMVGDQSCCPGCRLAAKNAVKQSDTLDQIRRREKFFGVTA
jgi:hypothetical protein